jgi:hypothetical protein
VAECPEGREALAQALEARRKGALNGESVPAAAAERMSRLVENLQAMIEPEARRMAGLDHKGSAPIDGGLVALIGRLAAAERDQLADLVMLDGHRGMVKPLHISVEEFRGLLDEFAGEQTVARRKLILHMQEQFRKRGIEMSCDTIEERFRAEPSVRTIPHCTRLILRDLGDEFRTGLIPIERLVGDEDPDRWLARAEEKLKFRSQSAMHQAIAEATGLTYDCIHKALSGARKAKRIQKEIKGCLDGWLATAERGEDIPAREDHRGMPVEQVRALLPGLIAAFQTKESVYRAISERTGVRPGSVRRYFQNDGRLKFAPLSVHRVAQELSCAPPQELPAAQPPPARRIERLTSVARIACRTRLALEQWLRHNGDPDLHRRFKEMRLALIMKLDERRHSRRAAAAAL